jgi:hypothetical protein
VPHSPAAIGAALEQLLTDPAEASRLGIAAAEATRAALGIDVVFPLYLQACVDAMKLAGDGRRMPPPVVRWDPPMLRLGPEAGAEEWGSSLAAFAKRLEPGAREAFWSALSGRVSGWEEGVEARVAGHTAG